MIVFSLIFWRPCLLIRVRLFSVFKNSKSETKNILTNEERKIIFFMILDLNVGTNVFSVFRQQTTFRHNEV